MSLSKKLLATTSWAILLTAFVSTAAGDDEPTLPLLGDAITATTGEKHDWPVVKMADGLDGQAQEKIITSLKTRLKDFTRKSASAKFEKSSVDLGDNGHFRHYSWYFCAYGSLKHLTQENMIKEVFKGGGKGQGKHLLKVGEDSYDSSVQTDVIKKINLYTVTKSNQRMLKDADGEDRSFWAGSIVVLEDPKGQAQSMWSPSKDADNKKPYEGMGIYLKACELANVEGCLFVEVHLVFYEPMDWFQGKNLIGSKLPLAVRDQVSALRRSLGKAAAKE